MARIMALDYGQKRTGIAVTDPLQIIASALTTVETKMLVPFLNNYFASESVERVIIGYPLHIDGNPTHNTERVEKFFERFQRVYPTIPIEKVDESHTSKMAAATMVAAGIRKSQRQVKGNLDKISATIMLQEFLENQ